MQKDKIITIRKNIYAIKEKVDGKTEIPDRDIIILVHGYNVSEEGAKEAYTKFQENFSKYSSQLSKLNKAIYCFLWPSDKPNKLDSILSYFKTVNTAKICGERFAKYLNKLNLISTSNEQPRITLIGHSLGCRLLLEALKKTVNTNLRLEVFLMAPAVPVSMVQPDKQLNSSISSTEKYSILYSKKDDVLKWTFPLGQKLAGEGFDEAVGLKGNPHKGV
ncbi:MAG: alpha/beta hydrolase [Okeania sp. SIO2C2]|uniref:alpha/beta hydrolase n=1 Tax=Okeania sp. SIO2C2 TaxID=2607787 RepID=UPI0013B6EECC|nr:alpha/beta hydrolase [Okeania sp. SIO2C2]NEP87016.1 alpha/beta hydrolase [Okeania sp. SIO2C2]